MKKRAISLLLLSGLAMSLCGCSALYNKEYLSVSQYTEGSYDEYESYMCDVGSFSELKSAIIQMVAEHSDEERIRFSDYDGSPQSDLAQACWEVKTETPLASYAVDYMSYDPSPILNYYEAVVYIAYKHSEEDIAAIVETANFEQLSASIVQALGKLSGSVAFRIPSSSITEEKVSQMVLSAYMENPTTCVVVPTVQVRLHPESGVFRIVEIEFFYGRTQAALGEMKQELSTRLSELLEKLQKEDKSIFALDAYNLLASNCDYDADGTIRRERGLEGDLGATAYGALVQGCASSQGIASAYGALCRAADIPCVVVSGSVDKEPHYWNIIELDGEYYHVDVSADSIWGMGQSFLMSDEQMQGRYWWNIEELRLPE